jgi:replicative DNA helicase
MRREEYDGITLSVYDLITFRYIPPVDTALTLLERHFFNRTDRVAFKPPWESAACPAIAGEHLTGYLKAHVSRRTRVKVRWTSQKHPEGGGTKTGHWRIGSYAPAPDGTTRWLVLDFDGGSDHSSPLADPTAAALFVHCLGWKLGLPCYLERSKSGSGWHLWIFFDPPIPARDARALGVALVPNDLLLTDGRFADASKGIGVEVFPKADDLAGGKSVGHQVWLPWFAEAAPGGNVFYRPIERRGLCPYIPEEFLTATAEQVTAARAKLREDCKEAAAAEAPEAADGPTPSANGRAESNGHASNDQSEGRRSPFVGKATGTGDWKAWRAEALARLRLEAPDVYGDILTGKQQGPGWLEARDLLSRTRDRHPSAGVSDCAEGVERGVFKSFLAGGRTLSVFDYLIERGRAVDFRDAQRIVAEQTGVPLPSRPMATGPSEQGDGGGEETDGFSLNWITSAQFASGDFRPKWLIEDILVCNEPAFCGGPNKSLKTSLMVDAAVSLGAAKPFLGKFSVPRVVRVGMLSGESGKHALQQTALRVCQAKGVDLNSVNILWEFCLPQLANLAHLSHLAESLHKNGIEVLLLDPLYLSLLSGSEAKGLQASNLFDIGPLLLSVSRTCLAAGCTPLLIHHTRKNVADPYQPLELQDLAFSGCAEFARQWILVNRRLKFEEGSGQHRLWFSVGGSQGHSHLLGVNVDEGTLQRDFTGRKWDVTLVDPNTAREEAEESREARKDERQQKKVIKDGTRILNALDLIDPEREGVSKTKLCTATKFSGSRLNTALKALKDEGHIEIVAGTVPGGNGSQSKCDLIRRRTSGCFTGKAV